MKNFKHVPSERREECSVLKGFKQRSGLTDTWEMPGDGGEKSAGGPVRKLSPWPRRGQRCLGLWDELRSDRLEKGNHKAKADGAHPAG